MTLLFGDGVPSVLGTHTLSGGSSVLLLFSFGFGCGCGCNVSDGNADRLTASCKVGCKDSAKVAVRIANGDAN